MAEPLFTSTQASFKPPIHQQPFTTATPAHHPTSDAQSSFASVEVKPDISQNSHPCQQWSVVKPLLRRQSSSAVLHVPWINPEELKIPLKRSLPLLQGSQLPLPTALPALGFCTMHSVPVASRQLGAVGGGRGTLCAAKQVTGKRKSRAFSLLCLHRLRKTKNNL